MLRRGNRDNLLSDQKRYEQILQDYDRIGQKKEREDGEYIITILIISTTLILIFGSIISILHTLHGIYK